MVEGKFPEARKINNLMNSLKKAHTKEHSPLENLEFCKECFQDWPCPTILMLDNYEELIKLVTHLRPEVLEFAGEMEKKLRKYDGDRDGWNIDLGKRDAKKLLKLQYAMSEHQIKLHNLMFLNSYRGDTFKDVTPEFLDSVISSAADVANFAMMIADNARRWKELLKERQGDEANT